MKFKGNDHNVVNISRFLYLVVGDAAVIIVTIAATMMAAAFVPSILRR